MYKTIVPVTAFSHAFNLAWQIREYQTKIHHPSNVNTKTDNSEQMRLDGDAEIQVNTKPDNTKVRLISAMIGKFYFFLVIKYWLIRILNNIDKHLLHLIILCILLAPYTLSLSILDETYDS